MRRLISILLLALLPGWAAADGAPREVTGQIRGFYVEIERDVYRLASDEERKSGVKLWVDVYFSKAALGRKRFAMVELSPGQRFDRGDLVLAKLAPVQHPFAVRLAVLTEQNRMLALRAKYFTDLAQRYDDAADGRQHLARLP